MLFICDEYPPGKAGGIGTCVQLLSRELVGQGHEVYVAGLYPFFYGQADYELDQGVKVWRLRYGLKSELFQTELFVRLFNRLPYFIRALINGKKHTDKFSVFVSKLVSENKIEIAEHPDFLCFTANLGRTVRLPELKIPLVVKIHGSYSYFEMEAGRVPDPRKKKEDELLFDSAFAISAVSEYAARITSSIFGMKRDIRVIHNGIIIPDSIPANTLSSKLVFFSGTLVPKKGIYSLLKAWNLVAARHPDAVLRVFGKGKIKKLDQYLDKKNRNSVKFMGHVNRDKLMAAISESSMAVFPSYSETFGMGVVEAMSLRCPVIYTRRSCGPEIVNDQTDGLLVDPDSDSEIAEKICLLFENRELAQRLATRGFEKVKQNFNITRCAQKNIAFYNETLQKFNQPHHSKY